ncbi:MAG TPA: phosphoribosyltransferase [Bryobacteraceae bacterium]|nr:phosphoribosyltransferase [Bryobacteraceae bacterium]
MNLLPSADDVVHILRQTGALRHGHFEFPNGSHSNEYVQVPLAIRHFQHAKTLSVGLSRLLRANSEIRPLIPHLSIVSPGMGGLPVAYGICEALRANKVYWAEREGHGTPYRFRPFIQPDPGEQVMLVDDILHSGANLADLKSTIENYGASVIGLAVIVYQPTPRAHDFGGLPLYYLAKLDASYFASAATCDMCSSVQPLTRVWI